MVKRRKAKYVMSQSRVERLKREVFSLEDVVAAKSRGDKVPRIQYANGGYVDGLRKKRRFERATVVYVWVGGCSPLPF